MSCKYCSSCKLAEDYSDADYESLKEKEVLALDKKIKRNIAIYSKSEYLLGILSKDLDVYVRAYVASNKYTDSETLYLLGNDSENYVLERLASNINADKFTLARVAQNTKYSEALIILVYNPNVDEKTLEYLIREKSAPVVLAIVASPRISPSLVKVIIEELPFLEDLRGDRIVSTIKDKIIGTLLRNPKMTQDIFKLVKDLIPEKFIYKHHLEKYYKNLLTTEDLINIKDGKLENHHKTNIKNTEGLDEQYFKSLKLAEHIEQTAKETEELFRKVYKGVQEKEPIETSNHGEGSKESTNLKEALKIAKENDFEIVNRYKVPEIKDKQEFINEVLNKNYLPLIKKLYIGLNILINAAHTSGTVLGHPDFLPVLDKALKFYDNREVTNYLHDLSQLGSKFNSRGGLKSVNQLQAEAEFIQSAKQKVRNMLSKRGCKYCSRLRVSDHVDDLKKKLEEFLVKLETSISFTDLKEFTEVLVDLLRKDLPFLITKEQEILKLFPKIELNPNAYGFFNSHFFGMLYKKNSCPLLINYCLAYMIKEKEDYFLKDFIESLYEDKPFNNQIPSLAGKKPEEIVPHSIKDSDLEDYYKISHEHGYKANALNASGYTDNYYLKYIHDYDFYIKENTLLNKMFDSVYEGVFRKYKSEVLHHGEDNDVPIKIGKVLKEASPYYKNIIDITPSISLQQQVKNLRVLNKNKQAEQLIDEFLNNKVKLISLKNVAFHKLITLAHHNGKLLGDLGGVNLYLSDSETFGDKDHGIDLLNELAHLPKRSAVLQLTSEETSVFEKLKKNKYNDSNFTEQELNILNKIENKAHDYFKNVYRVKKFSEYASAKNAKGVPYKEYLEYPEEFPSDGTPGDYMDYAPAPNKGTDSNPNMPLEDDYYPNDKDFPNYALIDKHKNILPEFDVTFLSDLDPDELETDHSTIPNRQVNPINMVWDTEFYDYPTSTKIKDRNSPEYYNNRDVTGRSKRAVKILKDTPPKIGDLFLIDSKTFFRNAPELVKRPALVWIEDELGNGYYLGRHIDTYKVCKFYWSPSSMDRDGVVVRDFQ